MLDDMTLAQKAQVAREWFRRFTTGAMQFNRNTSGTFLNLLEEIETGAAQATRDLNAANAHLPVLAEAATHHGGNVVVLRRKEDGPS